MLKTDSIVKALSLTYIPSLDTFKVTPPSIDIHKCITKRQVLSFVSKFYDPLGLVGPVIVTA